MPKRCSRREKRKDYARKRPSKWLTVYKIPCVSRSRGEKKTPELLSLAGCKREHVVQGCGSARCIYHCDVNGDRDLSICAIVHDVHLLGRLALSLCFDTDVCTIGKLSQRAATTGREDHDCANGGDSWLHVDVITNANDEIKL